MPDVWQKRIEINLDTKIFDTLLEPVFVISPDKKILYCNEPAAAICDSSARKLQRQNPKLDEVFIFSDPLQHIDSLSKIEEPTSYQEVSFKTLTEKVGKVQITFQPFETAKDLKCYLVYFRDVTLEETLQKKYRAELEQKEDVINDLRKAQAELKNYSENLEKMVADRTAEISRLNQTMRALLDSLSQGFFLFDQSGTCLDVYSKASLQTVECIPAGKKIWDVFKIDEKKVVGFQKWLQTLFAEMLPFEDLIPLAPQMYPHSQGQHIQLEYYPLKDSNQKIQGVVVVSTDITNLVEAQKAAAEERSHAKMIMTIIKNRRQTHSFIRESQCLINELKSYSLKLDQEQENVFRILHTLKGGSASFSLKAVADLCHEAETYLSKWKENPSSENKLKLDELISKIPLQFENFLTDNTTLIGNQDQTQERWVEGPLSQFLKFQSQLSAELSEKFQHEFLLEPVSNFVSSYGEVMTQVALREGKSIHDHILHNGNIKILPEPYENLFNTLIHAYRNAVDHGIESPEIRESLGKDPQGRIQTSFQILRGPQSSMLQIKIQDDGSGINPQKIREKLISKGLNVEHENEFQLIQHVFDSELSTKDVVTETSGRGVGMDAILHAAKRLKGKAWVESTLGKGTSLFIEVPLVYEQNTSQQKAS